MHDVLSSYMDQIVVVDGRPWCSRIRRREAQDHITGYDASLVRFKDEPDETVIGSATVTDGLIWDLPCAPRVRAEIARARSLQSLARRPTRRLTMNR